MSNEQEDAVFVRNFSVVLAGLTIIGLICFILAKIVNGNFADTQDGDRSASKRIAPAGSVNIGEPMVLAQTGDGTAATSGAGGGSSMADSDDPGEATYGKICFSCHDGGIGGAPKLADQAAWGPRLDKGTEMLVMNAINGFQDEALLPMPARGGLPNLSDDEVRAAVMFMLDKLNADDDAPSSAATESAPEKVMDAAVAVVADAANSVVETVSEAMPAVATNEAAVATADGRGKEVYDAACFICHASGVSGAPKYGDAQAWVAPVAKGMATLHTHAIKGFMGENGFMPPKGGRPDFSDDDIKAAVDFMANSGK